MPDTIPGYDDLKEVVKNWEDSDAINLGISWYDRDQIETEDLLHHVNIKNGNVVLNRYRPNDDIWKIEAMRGLVYAILPNNIEDLSRWQYATLVAIFICPLKFINYTIKSRFLREWEKVSSHKTNKNLSYDYFRTYQILNSHTKTIIPDLLHQFIYSSKMDLTKKLEEKFNNFLFTKWVKPDPDDIPYLAFFLKNQTLDIKLLMSEYPMLSQSKAYEIRNRLDFILKEYLIPIRSKLGLYKIYFQYLNEIQDNKLKEIQFFENFENLEEESSNERLLRMRIPHSHVIRLVNALNNIDFDSHIFIVFPESSEIRISPEMYDILNDKWYSVFNVEKEVIRFKESQFLSEEVSPVLNLKKDELIMLKQILRNRDDNPANNVYNFSKQNTKKLIRSIQKKDLYGRSIAWFRPKETFTGLLYLPLLYSEEENVSQDIILDALEKMDFRDVLLQNESNFGKNKLILDEIMKKSWIFLAMEYVVRINKENDSLNFQFGVLFRISGERSDILRLNEIYPEITLFGFQHPNSGTIITIPTEKFNEGEWDYDVSAMINILEK